MKKKIMGILAIGFVSANLLLPNTTYAWKTVYDASNYKQNLAIKLETIKQTAHQAQQVSNQLKNLSKLNPAYQDETLAQIRNSINSVNDIRSSVNAIGTDFNSMMESFDELSPDYADWNGASAEDYSKQVDKLRAAWDKAVNQSLLTQGIASPESQQKTTDVVADIVEAAQNAEGTQGALQALTQLNGLLINEIQKMQAIAADAERTQNMYFKRQIDAEEAGRKRAEVSRQQYEKNMKKDVQITDTNEEIHHFPEN